MGVSTHSLVAGEANPSPARPRAGPASKVNPHLEYCVHCPVQACELGPDTEHWEIPEKVHGQIDWWYWNYTIPYGARLQSFNLTKLAERRIRGDLIEVFKIARDIVNYGHKDVTL